MAGSRIFGKSVPRFFMTRPNPDKILLLILRLGAFACFAGWAWVHFYWEGPYGILLWHDTTFSLADQLGIGWKEFVGSGADDGMVQKWLARIGWLYLVCSVLSLTVREKSWIQMAGLIGGSGLLVMMGYAKYLGSRGQFPMFVEHGGQMLIPVILVLALIYGVRHRFTVTTAMVAVVLIFAGHGAYALGYYWPTPPNFYGMTSIILGVESSTAGIILRVAGVLDLLVCIGIFIPALRWGSACYAMAWGFLTALARPVSGMSTELNYWGADQYIHEAVLRAPHFMIPLYLLYLWRKSPSTETLAIPRAHAEEDTDLQSCRS